MQAGAMRVLHMDAAVSTDGPQTLASTFKDEIFGQSRSSPACSSSEEVMGMVGWWCRWSDGRVVVVGVIGVVGLVGVVALVLVVVVVVMVMVVVVVVVW